MTISEHLEALRAVLAEWAREHRGTVVIAGDVTELPALLEPAPGAPRGILVFDSEEPRGEMETGRVDRKYFLIISRGKGLNIDRGENLTGNKSSIGLIDLVEQAREIVRNAQVEPADEMDEEDRRVRYNATRRFNLLDIATDAQQIEFTIAANLPALADDAPEDSNE